MDKNGNGSRIGNGSGKSNREQMDEIGSGIDRLSLRTGSEIIFIDKEAIKLADILRRSTRDSKRTANNVITEQFNLLLLYLANEGNWNISRYGNRIKPLLDDDKKGVEADVYLLDDYGKFKVIKVTKWWVRQQSPLEFVENKILLHNIIFSEIPYKLIGLKYERGEFLFILEQPYVKSMKGAKVTQQEIDEDMKKRGFIKYGSAFHSEYYIISDLNSKNVLKGLDNELYYIDPIIYPNLSYTEI